MDLLQFLKTDIYNRPMDKILPYKERLDQLFHRIGVKFRGENGLLKQDEFEKFAKEFKLNKVFFYKEKIDVNPSKPIFAQLGENDQELIEDFILGTYTEILRLFQFFGSEYKRKNTWILDNTRQMLLDYGFGKSISIFDLSYMTQGDLPGQNYTGSKILISKLEKRKENPGDIIKLLKNREDRPAPPILIRIYSEK